jgi:PhnB protein
VSVQTSSGNISVRPLLEVADVIQEMEFAKAVFDAGVRIEQRNAEGVILQGEIQIGDLTIVVVPIGNDLTAVPASFWVQTEDVEVIYQRALERGGIPTSPGGNAQSSSNGIKGFKDPSGNTWWLTYKKQKRSNQEISRLLTEQRKKRL